MQEIFVFIIDHIIEIFDWVLYPYIFYYLLLKGKLFSVIRQFKDFLFLLKPSLFLYLIQFLLIQEIFPKHLVILVSFYLFFLEIEFLLNLVESVFTFRPHQSLRSDRSIYNRIECWKFLRFIDISIHNNLKEVLSGRIENIFWIQLFKFFSIFILYFSKIHLLN